MKTKENVKKSNFTKLTRTGISLIVLVITIIVIIILAAAIIISLNNNNPIMEANTARYESDRVNMQAVFTNAIAKIMAKNQATVSVTAGQINTTTKGTKETIGEVVYTLTDAQNSDYSSGKIVFDTKKANTDTIFYTGKKLPIYAAGDTKWYVDEEGNISLEVAGTKYGSGEISDTIQIPENALVNMYEDLAGDETGATVGKLHIGDYVDYNPIATGVTEKTVTNGYKYISENEVSGVTESIENNFNINILESVTEQRFTAQDDLKWRVLGKDGNNILITTEEPIKPDSPITDNNGDTGYFMYGARSYINGITELNNIAAIYGNGDLAENANSMTINHVNKITGVTVTESDITPNGVEENISWGWNSYGSEYNYAAGSTSGWNPQSYLAKEEAENRGETVDITSPGMSGKSNAYVYDLTNTNLKTANTTSVRYDLIYKNSTPYYLASRGIISLNDDLSYGPGMVYDACASSAMNLWYSKGDTAIRSFGAAIGVRPVVSLKADIIGEIQSTDANGVATWHIE